MPASSSRMQGMVGACSGDFPIGSGGLASPRSRLPVLLPSPGPTQDGSSSLCPCPMAQAETGAAGIPVSSASSWGPSVPDQKDVTWGKVRS